MKRMVILVVVVLLATVSQAVDLKVEARGFAPRMDEFHNHSAGSQVMAIHWLDEQYGIGLSAGYEHWRTDVPRTTTPANLGTAMFKLNGQNDMFPLGAHALWRFTSLPPYKKADWMVSLGAVYMISNPKSHVDYVYTGPGGPVTGDFPVEIDDAIALELAVNLVQPVFGQKMIVGFGYRRTVKEGKIEIPGLNFETDNDMNAFFATLGVIFELQE